MNKLMSWFTDSLAPGMQKIFDNPWISAVASSMQKILPFILVGSVISIYNVFVRYIPSLPDLSFVNTFSFGMMSLIVAFMVAYFGMIELDHPKYTITAGLTSLTAFLLSLFPSMASIIVSDTGLKTFQIQDINYIGGSGLFISILIALFVMVVFHFYAKLHILEDSVSVPDFVCEWINNIIPMTLIYLVIGILTIQLQIDLVLFINWLFQPVVSIGQSLPGFIIISFLYVLLYSLGISAWSLNAIVKPILMAGISANAELALAGGSPIYIVTTETIFTTALVAMGGLGATLPLNILMLVKCKSKKLKTMGKICIGPSIFNINEPLVYGAPIVFNPLLMIPMWVNSIVGAIVVWFAMSLGFLNIPAGVNNISRIPAPICTWLTTDDFRAFIWFFVLFVIYTIIWYPFLMKYDKQLLDKEKNK
ncbi:MULTISPECIES: PTS sugar transporter subunit IIC [Faecalicoccus]|uniref:PTS sugar transporter subunit IIC n=1 Tax=Faecalicoccus TaxID=1573536 RepID=UPI0022E38FC5|nr:MULTISPECIES: PTS transporter subunit EIIC [Faecalicoccus]MDB7987792.1 PTS transporter subunit EIIC [Faecalicoccus pleomorphus]MDB7992163.1 PTS transporter subunit EIIC [Faecalicoccus pleomorphus]MDM8292667.1 PTS transporter subunit EIIC [Faecalicoccus pleomorphus]MDY4279224.1 PTS transporter subunit EIIC [Faecalicoccus sp.]